MSKDSIKRDDGSSATMLATPEALPVEQPTVSEGAKFTGTVTTVLMAGLLYVVPTIITIVLLQSWLAGNGYSITEITDYFDTTFGQFVFMLSMGVISVVVLALLMRITHESRASIALTRPRANALAQFGKAVLVYYSLLFAAGIIIQEFTSIDTNQEQDIGFTDVPEGQLWFVFVSLVIVPPITEELIFRGFLYTRFRKYYSVVTSAIVISILFSVAHLQLGNGDAPLWTAAIDTFMLSLILLWLREKTGSIIPGIGLHALKNGLAFTVLFLLK